MNKKFTIILTIFLISSSVSAEEHSFRELPIHNITPTGWLYNILQIQNENLTSNIEVRGYPFNTEMWGGEKNEIKDWAGYEQTAYWIDGALRLSYLLKDSTLMNRVKQQISYQLDNANKDTGLGPSACNNLWPFVVFYRALIAEYEVSKDNRIIDALELTYNSDKFSVEQLYNNKEDFGERAIFHIEILSWLYETTGKQAF